MKNKSKKLSSKELEDFRVPIDIFKSHCRFLRKSKEMVKDQILRAVGIDIHASGAKVDWEAFLTIGMYLNVECHDREG